MIPRCACCHGTRPPGRTSIRLGEPFDATGPTDPGRAVTVLAHDGAPLAAVVHDAALAEEPGLLAAVVAAVRLTVQHERLEHEVARQLEDVRASRARIVEAGDEERDGSSATCMTARSSDSSPLPCGPVEPRTRSARSVRRRGLPLDRGGGHRHPRGHPRAGGRDPSSDPDRGRPGGRHPDPCRPFADPGHGPSRDPGSAPDDRPKRPRTSSWLRR